MTNYPTLQDILVAREWLKPHIRRTPILRADKIETAAGCLLFLKPETLQITGAFKLRGASRSTRGIFFQTRVGFR